VIPPGPLTSLGFLGFAANRSTESSNASVFLSSRARFFRSAKTLLNSRSPVKPLEFMRASSFTDRLPVGAVPPGTAVAFLSGQRHFIASTTILAGEEATT
jgi:hypothetical protein